jgi:glutaredoxin 2
MNLELLHYVHCPFCIRVRMTLGLLNLEYKSRVVPYNDEMTPVDLTGKKMLPILIHDGVAMNESADIMKFLDQGKRLKFTPDLKDLEAELIALGESIHSVAMPYWSLTPEFNAEAKKYFVEKKEKKRGPFKDLVKNQKTFIAKVETELQPFAKKLRPFYDSETFRVQDIFVAAHLWGLYVVPEFQFSPDLHQYLQRVKQITRFDYHQDFWT